MSYNMHKSEEQTTKIWRAMAEKSGPCYLTPDGHNIIDSVAAYLEFKQDVPVIALCEGWRQVVGAENEDYKNFQDIVKRYMSIGQLSKRTKYKDCLNSMRSDLTSYLNKDLPKKTSTATTTQTTRTTSPKDPLQGQVWYKTFEKLGFYPPKGISQEIVNSKPELILDDLVGAYINLDIDGDSNIQPTIKKVLDIIKELIGDRAFYNLCPKSLYADEMTKNSITDILFGGGGECKESVAIQETRANLKESLTKLLSLKQPIHILRRGTAKPPTIFGGIPSSPALPKHEDEGDNSQKSPIYKALLPHFQNELGFYKNANHQPFSLAFRMIGILAKNKVKTEYLLNVIKNIVGDKHFKEYSSNYCTGYNKIKQTTYLEDNDPNAMIALAWWIKQDCPLNEDKHHCWLKYPEHLKFPFLPFTAPKDYPPNTPIVKELIERYKKGNRFVDKYDENKSPYENATKLFNVIRNGNDNKTKKLLGHLKDIQGAERYHDYSTNYCEHFNALANSANLYKMPEIHRQQLMLWTAQDCPSSNPAPTAQDVQHFGLKR